VNRTCPGDDGVALFRQPGRPCAVRFSARGCVIGQRSVSPSTNSVASLLAAGASANRFTLGQVAISAVVFAGSDRLCSTMRRREQRLGRVAGDTIMSAQIMLVQALRMVASVGQTRGPWVWACQLWLTRVLARPSRPCRDKSIGGGPFPRIGPRPPACRARSSPEDFQATGRLSTARLPPAICVCAWLAMRFVPAIANVSAVALQIGYRSESAF